MKDKNNFQKMNCDDCIHLHYLGDKIICDCEECNNMNCYREECEDEIDD